MSVKIKSFMEVFHCVFCPSKDEGKARRQEYINHFRTREEILDFARYVKSTIKKNFKKESFA